MELMPLELDRRVNKTHQTTSESQVWSPKNPASQVEAQCEVFDGSNGDPEDSSSSLLATRDSRIRGEEERSPALEFEFQLNPVI